MMSLGHNGTTRTYMVVQRLHYWKGLNIYINQWLLCQKKKYTGSQVSWTTFLHTQVTQAIHILDLIGPFNLSIKALKNELITICVLTGYTSCILLKTKIATTVVQAYADDVYAKYGRSSKILLDNGTEFKNQLFTKTAIQLGV